MKNTITINRNLLDLAIRHYKGETISEMEFVNLLINYEDNIIVDQHLLLYRLVSKYDLVLVNGYIDQMKPYVWLMTVLKDFRDVLNKKMEF